IFKETKILNIKQNAILSAPVLTYSVAFLFFLGVSAPVLTNKPLFYGANSTIHLCYNKQKR
ncbi:MAG: hypothetical protein WAR39_04325, partial [Prevotella sp.]